MITGDAVQCAARQRARGETKRKTKKKKSLTNTLTLSPPLSSACPLPTLAQPEESSDASTATLCLFYCLGTACRSLCRGLFSPLPLCRNLMIFVSTLSSLSLGLFSLSFALCGCALYDRLLHILSLRSQSPFNASSLDLPPLSSFPPFHPVLHFGSFSRASPTSVPFCSP